MAILTDETGSGHCKGRREKLELGQGQITSEVVELEAPHLQKKGFCSLNVLFVIGEA